VTSRLDALSDIGITALQLMPVAAVSGARNWGYDGVSPYAPAESLGTPDALKALVDAAHGRSMMVLLDVVYNHFGPDGNHLPALAPDFFDAAAQTPWGAAIDFRRDPVARFFIDNARYWLEEFGFDGLRFDAAHAINDNAFLDRLAREVRDNLDEREVHLILENENNDAERLRRGFTAQWNDDFHNVLHVMLTGETHGYYQDFADAPADLLARALAEGFIYQGEESPHSGRRRGGPSADLRPTAFVNFLQNHDQIGNRAFGERLTSLASPEKLRAAMGLVLLGPAIPLLFMGEQEGSQTPFLFFTDFHDELAKAVREGRRREFARFPEFSDSDRRARIPDPNAPATFEASRPAPGPDADGWRALVKQLLRLRADVLTPHLANCRNLSSQALGVAAVQARWRLDSKVMTLAINLGDHPVDLPGVPNAAPFCIVGAPVTDLVLPPASFVAWLDPHDGR
jgi:maltooligosyltrehalose trehalohydrolase